ncbi:MAG: cation:proton antiporter [Thermotaleaceae bacterium]
MVLLSIIMILFLGLIANRLFQSMRLPGILGMIFVGVLLGPYVTNSLDMEILRLSKDIRMLALIIILLRAGLGLNKDSLKKVGAVALRMTAIPCIFEGLTIMGIAHYLLGLSLVDSGMLGFIIAAVSPAVVVPAMINLKENGLGMKKGIPIIILAGASADDIFAITLFYSFLSMALSGGQASIVNQIARIPVEVIGGILLGLILGYGLSLFYKKSKIRLRETEEVLVLIATAIGMTLIGDRIHVAGLLAVMTAGFVILEKSSKQAEKLSSALSHIWVCAEIFLFVLIGAEVNIQVALQAGGLGILVILIGLIGRSIGVFLATSHSHLNWKERLFCAIAYMPKATVQAAIGGIPLTAGIATGDRILALAVMAIVITAPLGAIGIKLFAPMLLEKEFTLDEEA